VRFHAACTLALLAASCGPATTKPVVKPPVTPPPPKEVAKPAESPARWVLLPSGAVTADARYIVEGVGTLFVGTSGDRWLEKKGVGLVAAEMLIAEPVRGVSRDEGGRFAFVGATGTVYFTKDPLGPVVETRVNKTPLRSVSVGKKAILGLNHGVLTRSSDLGATWAPVTTPKVNGALMQVAMLGVEGLALGAPQQLLASEDDGATWQLVATPGIGARRVVADANGDLILEGLTASAVLRTSPLRLEKIARAPTAGWDLPLTDAHGVLLGSDAVFSGSAALIGDRYVEAVQDQELGDKWRLAITELGKTPKLRQPAELDHCERVYVAGDANTILAGCANPTTVAAPKSKWGPSPGWTALQMKLFKSTDGGVTFKEDGVALASDREKLMWLSPEGVLIIDGVCKRSRSDYDCYDSPPVVRPPGAKLFAKAISAPGSRFERVVFGPNNHAYALGTDQQGRELLWVSNNGGRDFARRPLQPVLDEKNIAHSPASGGVALGADEAGVYVVARSDHNGRIIRYAAAPDGTGAQGALVEYDFDAFDLHGKRGFAYDLAGKGYETADGGATWKKVPAPAINSSMPSDRYVACSAYGCLIADRATRVGWDLPLGAASPSEAKAQAKKTVGRTPLKCSAEGEWKPLPGVSTLGSTQNADLGGPSRWVLAKRDAAKGALSAVVGSIGPKGLDTKEITLMPAGSVDSASFVSMQVEGVVALRYNFKRDKSPAAPPPPLMKPPPSGGKPYPPYPYPYPSYASKFPAITPKQIVDVDVAWYVAATGKTHKATIKNAGAIDPTKDVVDGREQPSSARIALLSIAAGGVHVRPFASAGTDAPLYFVSEGGKVEKLVWPEIPTKDVRGRILNLRIDAARVNNKSIVFGDTGGGLQMFLAWANAGGTAWETRTWGLWPELEEARDVGLRFIDSGDKPILGVLAAPNKEFAGAAFAVPIEAMKSDPDVLATLPSQKTMTDPPRACAKGATPPWRITMPFSTGTRHPVSISTDGRELLFATSHQLFHAGPGGEPCVSAIDAQYISTPTVKLTSGESYAVLIAPDDPAHSTLFRSMWKTGGGGSETSIRTMSCAFVPGPVPEALLNTAGFVE